MKKVIYYIFGGILVIFFAIFAITRTYKLENFLLFDKIWNNIYTKITYVEIIGNDIIPTEDIVSMLYNTNIRDEFILKNKKQIIASLKKNEMIEDIILKINLPNKLVIAIKERKPLLAYHNSEGNLKYVDVNFNEFQTNYLNPRHLIYLRGKYNKEKVQNLTQILKKYDAVYQNLTEIENFADYRFNIVLNNKTQVFLPETKIEKTLELLNSYVINYDILHKNIYKIDFRSENKVYISHGNQEMKYKPQPIKVVIYKNESEVQQYKEMISRIITTLN